jgi:hypothetical protein
LVGIVLIRASRGPSSQDDNLLVVIWKPAKDIKKPPVNFLIYAVH